MVPAIGARLPRAAPRRKGVVTDFGPGTVSDRQTSGPCRHCLPCLLPLATCRFCEPGRLHCSTNMLNSLRDFCSSTSITNYRLLDYLPTCTRASSRATRWTGRQCCSPRRMAQQQGGYVWRRLPLGRPPSRRLGSERSQPLREFPKSRSCKKRLPSAPSKNSPGVALCMDSTSKTGLTPKRN